MAVINGSTRDTYVSIGTAVSTIIRKMLFFSSMLPFLNLPKWIGEELLPIRLHHFFHITHLITLMRLQHSG
jgi:hypothetical protein